MSRSFLVLLVLGLASCQRRKLNYRDCGSTAKLLAVEIEPCDSDPCVFKRGTDTKIYFEMISDQNSDTVTLDVRVKMFGFDMPVPGIETDLCNGVIKCPVVKGQTYKGTIIFPVRAASPQMKSVVTLKVLGEHGTSVCTKTDILVQ
ncbi:mite group 2 allergen-like Ixo r 2 [Ixodes scapularis]|uniref:mite group 2 allergen-like Ixo r 2 n=1 Tax=Ixodes scapularis TaxID=6945 RepID=UPI0011619438|nr:mite group 2 allergen-like Ixo r 2 [Ixodes scapularis]